MLFTAHAGQSAGAYSTGANSRALRGGLLLEGAEQETAVFLAGMTYV
jgi:hypothetical protein